MVSTFLVLSEFSNVSWMTKITRFSTDLLCRKHSCKALTSSFLLWMLIIPMIRSINKVHFTIIILSQIKCLLCSTSSWELRWSVGLLMLSHFRHSARKFFFQGLKEFAALKCSSTLNSFIMAFNNWWCRKWKYKTKKSKTSKQKQRSENGVEIQASFSISRKLSRYAKNFY